MAFEEQVVNQPSIIGCLRVGDVCSD